MFQDDAVVVQRSVLNGRLPMETIVFANPPTKEDKKVHPEIDVVYTAYDYMLEFPDNKIPKNWISKPGDQTPIYSRLSAYKLTEEQLVAKLVTLRANTSFRVAEQAPSATDTIDRDALRKLFA
jgi:hypothetical protein